MEKKANKKHVEEKNKELKDKIEDVKENLSETAKDIKKNFTKQAEELKKDIEEKSEDIKEDLKVKSKEIKQELQEKGKDIKEEFIEKTEELKDKTEEVLKNIKDNSKKFDKKDIEENKAMAAFAYIIPPVPYFVETKSKWVRYHAIQGMNLFIIFIILSLGVSILNSLVLWIFPFLKVILRTALYTFIVIFALIGIVNVCNGEAKELPFINKFKFIKK